MERSRVKRKRAFKECQAVTACANTWTQVRKTVCLLYHLATQPTKIRRFFLYLSILTQYHTKSEKRVVMCIILCSMFTRQPPRMPHEASTHQCTRQTARRIRLARYRTLIHQHAPFLLGWTPNDTETYHNGDHGSDESKAILPPYIPRTTEVQS